MKPDFKATVYYSNAYWYRRPETALTVAHRWISYMDSLAEASNLLDKWAALTRRRSVPFSMARRDLTAFVEGNRTRYEDGEIYPEEGFSLSAYTRGQPQNFSMRGAVGRNYESLDTNHFQFETARGQWPDLSLVTYALFRSVILATIACWEPLYCNAQPSTLHPFEAPKSWFNLSWITYVHPNLVHRVTPHDIPVVEPTPDGGLLLAATTDTFSVDNPVHLDAARRIAAATAHLDDVMPPL